MKQLQKQLEESYQELSVLNNEIPKALMGNSAFKPELLNSLIEQRNSDINTRNAEITMLEQIVIEEKYPNKMYRDDTKLNPCLARILR
ncbi:hypothetical protein [Brevibacillus brevis]|uniref:Uncharacterized protein n=1 Tax=Brevibacillus brevis TaxID=1393 RepID=A0A517I9G5_BREBE|nr:hypothetical protein [Brevibacillus brevis]QDS35520.1 hypothetical protein FPS98_16720 [Brevibacillus brevis]